MLAFSQPELPLGDPPDSPESLSIALKRLESEKIPVLCGAGTMKDWADNRSGGTSSTQPITILSVQN